MVTTNIESVNKDEYVKEEKNPKGANGLPIEIQQDNATAVQIFPLLSLFQLDI